MLRSRKRPGGSPLAAAQPCPDESLAANGSDERKMHGKKVDSGWGQKIANASLLLVTATMGITAALATITGGVADVKCWVGIVCDGVRSSNTVDGVGGLRRASAASAQQQSVLPSRHPEYQFNTPEFKQKCAWTYSNKVRKQCTFLVRPSPKSGEGMAMWISNVAMGYVYAVQAGCKLVIDYGPSVEVDRVWSPPASLPAAQNWVVTPGYVCNEKDNCLIVTNKGPDALAMFLRTSVGSTRSIAHVPHYRMAYSRSDNETSAIEKLNLALPGFEYETGFACALGTLFDLPKSASDYLPSLFTHILPTVREPSSLVVTVYIRTGRTDDVASVEKGGKVSEYHNHTHIDADLMSCAISMEKEKLESASGKYSNVVWLVITDSPLLGPQIISQYSGKHESVLNNGKKIPRKVITTSSQGIQTRPARDPSTSDFADAALDWWLIGEADILVTHGATSFGTTAALRTAIPLYTAMKGECKLRKLDNDGTAIIPGFVQVKMNKDGHANILDALKAQGFTVNGKPIKGVKRIN